MPIDEEKTVTAEFKRRAMRWMAKNDISRSELSRRLDVTRGAVTQLFTTAKTSALVPAINALMADDDLPVLSDEETHIVEDIIDHLLRNGGELLPKQRADYLQLSQHGRDHLFHSMLERDQAQGRELNEARIRLHLAVQSMRNAEQAAEAIRTAIRNMQRLGWGPPEVTDED